MHTSTSSDSRSNVRRSKSPFSSVKRLDSDCEKARVWVGAVNNAVRRARRRPVDVKGLADWRAGVAMAEMEEVARENREGRISRLNRGKTAPFDAIAVCEIGDRRLRPGLLVATSNRHNQIERVNAETQDI
jgi:hypothetical protein